MKTAFEVFWNAEPEEKSELAFLKQLRADLNSAGISATILANYFTGSRLRQVDFLIITEKHVCHVELKSYTGVLHGGVNGPWSVERSDGTVEVLADRANPYTQALVCKMAISDDMHAVAEQDSRVPRPPGGKRFYTQLDSVVCLFPNLAAGSQVPSDYKVKTLGYADFVRFLTTPGKHPGWTGDHWSALIRLLGLTNAAAASSGRTTMRASAAQIVVSSYTRWFRDFYTRDLHELVPLPLNADGTALSPTAFADFLREAKHVQLVGPSGCGKSHLAKHLLIGLPDGSVPVLVEGTMYDGRLSMLLNRSVARFTTKSAAELLQAAAVNGQTVVLVIDGFNECPQSLQDRLLGDLSSFCRRTNAMTLITGQAAVTVPAPLAGELVRAGVLTAEDRQAVLTSYGAPGIVSLCEPFATAYELSIAAECASEIEGTVTRADLFSAFIRKRLSRVSSPAHTRDALRQLALVMDDRLLTSLPLDEVWRVIERHLANASAPVSVIDELLSSSLAVSRQGRFSFPHELLGRFLAVEALMLRNQDLPQLVQVLRRPRHEDLTQFAVELESDGGRASQLLAGLADWNLCAQAVRGNLGQTAARAARTAARRLLRDLTAAMDRTTFTIHPEYELTVAGGRELSAADRALLTAIGALVPEGEFLREAVSLLDATDAACWRSADVQAKEQRRRPTASGMVATVLAGLGGTARSTVAAAIILESMSGPRLDSRFRSSRGKPPVGAGALAGLIDMATPREHGRLLLLCELLRPMHGPDAASLALRLARLCWESGAYHVQLEGLTTIQSFAAETRDQPLGAEIVDLLESLNPDNIMLSTQLIESLYSYGRIESPYEEESVRAEIEEIIGGTAGARASERAYGIVSSQFEDVIGEPYFTAIEALSDDQRIKLYTIAALGAPAHGFWNDWLLAQLVKAADRTALPAFEQWATNLNLDGFYAQGSTACYMLAIQGCALFLDEPPGVTDCRTDDQAAWRCYGAIIFWMYRPQYGAEETLARCTPYWQRLTGELLPAAADPLCQFLWSNRSYDQEGGPVISRIMKVFPRDVCHVLEWGLEYHDSLTSIFPGHSRESRTADIIHMLSYVGNADTIELLRAYTDDERLGGDAIRAIEALQHEPDSER